jgi:hypothetical protein
MQRDDSRASSGCHPSPLLGPCTVSRTAPTVRGWPPPSSDAPGSFHHNAGSRAAANLLTDQLALLVADHLAQRDGQRV